MRRAGNRPANIPVDTDTPNVNSKTAGRIVIHGNGGRHIGSEMRGGEIHVLGDAGDWLGGEMHGGLIHARGRAGHLVGSAYRGSAKGMTKGTILVGGYRASDGAQAL